MSEQESHFIATCPHCATKLKIKRVYLGQMVNCKQCNHRFMGIEADDAVAFGSGEHSTEVSVEPARDGDRVLVVCEHCKASLSVKRARIGQVVLCKQCNGEVLVAAPRVTQSVPATGGHSAVTPEGLLALAAGRAGGDQHHDTVRAERDHLRAELEKLRVAHNLLEAELQQIEAACAGTLAENERLSEQLHRLSSDLDAARAERDACALEVAELRSALAARDQGTRPLEQEASRV